MERFTSAPDPIFYFGIVGGVAIAVAILFAYIEWWNGRN